MYGMCDIYYMPHPRSADSTLRKSFLRQLEKLWPAIKGSLSEVRKPCIRPNCAACASSEMPRSQTKPYEIPTDLLSRVSKKAVGHRPAAGGNCSAQSPVALPGADGQGRPLWLLDAFGQGASQSQYATGKFAAPGRRQTRPPWSWSPGL